MLYIFGKNSTICKGVVDSRGRSHAPNTLETQEFWDDVLPIITELRDKGHQIALCSNEGGVAFGIFSSDMAESLVRSAAEYIGASTYRLCCNHPNGKIAPFNQENPDRLPQPGMLLSIMAELGFSAQETVMVGDWNDEKRAAEIAGVQFRYSHEFFGRVDPFADRLHTVLSIPS